MTPQEKYDKDNTKMYAVKVGKNTEYDIYRKLESVSNKAGYIKQLIRNDISHQQQIDNRIQELVATDLQNCIDETQTNGMTDYQFKVFLMLLKSRFEQADKDDVIFELDRMIKDFK